MEREAVSLEGLGEAEKGEEAGEGQSQRKGRGGGEHCVYVCARVRRRDWRRGVAGKEGNKIPEEATSVALFTVLFWPRSLLVA